jgi:hypothetical protein
MVYVDLNPIRAGIAATPEEPAFTSIYERIRDMREPSEGRKNANVAVRLELRSFHSPSVPTNTIPYRLDDYLELVDWTGRVIRVDKRGFIDDCRPRIMQRLNIDADAWRLAMQPRGNVFGRAIGRLDQLRLHAKTLGQSWVRGLQPAARLYV